MAHAAPGDLDLTFSRDGKQRTDFGLGSRGAAATVRQPDGKIVAVGGAHGDFALTRYNPNGSLDPSFSGDGKQWTNFGGGDAAHGVALQANGKIVAAGVRGDPVSGGEVFAVSRYNPNGSLDTSFSGDGKQTTDFGSYLSSGIGASGVAIQGDGKIVVVGAADFGTARRDFALARYNPNGSLDTSFSGDGKQRTDFGGDFDSASGVALQGDGKIVVVGTDFASNDMPVARYNPNGSLDVSFSGDGKQTTDFGGSDEANGVAVQGDGKIVAVGNVHGPSESDFALARFDPNGSLDPSFSGDGQQTTDFGGFDSATGVALQGDGKIVAVGGTGAGGDFALARFDPNGSLDTSFSGDGKQTTDFGGSDGASGVALQGDGKIVAVGAAGGTASRDFALARYNPNGSLDTTFSGDGKQTTGGFAGVDTASAVALQSDGKIVAAGGAGDQVFALARYNPNGSLDTSFSGDGKQTTDFGDDGAARAVALQEDGKIVVAGFIGDFAGGDFALARYNPNGSLDTTFSGDGKQTTSFLGDDDAATGVAIQSNGKIVVVGLAGDSSIGSDFAVARYNPNGSLDTTFSGDGKQTTDFGDFSRAAGVALQGGKIVAVGSGGVGFAVVRYNPNGSLDTTFSGDGKQTTNFGGSEATGVAARSDGKIVAVGIGGAAGFGNGNFALARYNPNGSLDTSFSGDGKQMTSFGGFDRATGVALQANGRIVAAGGTGPVDVNDFALARYNPNGSLDTSFSGDGKQTTDFGGSDGANGVALQGGGKIVAVGVGRGTDLTYDFALARYLGG